VHFRARPVARRELGSFCYFAFAVTLHVARRRARPRKPLCGRTLAAKNPKWVCFVLSHWMEHSGTFGQLA
jgi:hypothetical protein